MILVDQTLFGDKTGNCFPACIATITGIPLEEIPNFCVLFGDDDWYDEFVGFLRGRGWAPISHVFQSDADRVAHLNWAERVCPGTPWIAAGPTDRGKHAVVYVGRNLFFDPNPRHGRKGIDKVEDSTFFVRTLNGLNWDLAAHGIARRHG